MSIWQTSPVSQTPGIQLTRWSIFEVPYDEHDSSSHFVGVNITEGGEGRVSSEIKSFDRETLSGGTASGRRYSLVGKPGHSMDAMYVWNSWKYINKVSNEKEVDLDYFCSKISTPRE